MKKQAGKLDDFVVVGESGRFGIDDQEVHGLADRKNAWALRSSEYALGGLSPIESQGSGPRSPCARGGSMTRNCIGSLNASCHLYSHKHHLSPGSTTDDKSLPFLAV